MKAIVYSGETGFTERYASVLAIALNLPKYTLKESKTGLTREDEVLYLGWVCAGVISGFGKAKKFFRVKAAVAVGMTEESKTYTETLRTANAVSVPLFYLRGGVNPAKLKGMKKFILRMVAKQTEKQNKPEDKELIDILKNGGSFFSEEKALKTAEEIQSLR